MIAKPFQLVVGLLLAAAPICAMAQDAPDSAAIAVPSQSVPVALANGAPERGIDPEEGAGGDLYCRRQLGTWFYCDKPKARPQSASPPQASAQVPA